MPTDSLVQAPSLRVAVELVRAELESKREAISRELCSIPPPVPACDVNFNRLLEERASIVDELQRLRRAAAAEGSSARSLRDFCRTSAYLCQETRDRLATLLVESCR